MNSTIFTNNGVRKLDIAEAMWLWTVALAWGQEQAGMGVPQGSLARSQMVVNRSVCTRTRITAQVTVNTDA